MKSELFKKFARKQLPLELLRTCISAVSLQILNFRVALCATFIYIKSNQRYLNIREGPTKSTTNPRTDKRKIIAESVNVKITESEARWIVAIAKLFRVSCKSEKITKPR